MGPRSPEIESDPGANRTHGLRFRNAPRGLETDEFRRRNASNPDEKARPAPQGAHKDFGPPEDGSHHLRAAGELVIEPFPEPRKLDVCWQCDGCGRIADSAGGEPWTVWQELQPPANVAVVTGVVSPVTCPACGGTGRAT